MDGYSIISSSKSIQIVAHHDHRNGLLVHQGPGPAFQRITIEVLPDDVLLDIFDFYQFLIKEYEDEFAWTWNWQKLVHVCRRWRYVVFGSPIRLNLQLLCKERSPVTKLLDVWPPLPLSIQFNNQYLLDNYRYCFDNLIAALERRDRICQITIADPIDFLPWNGIFTAMEEPFPALISLSLYATGETLTLPDTFLHGSAPCLRQLTLRAIELPSLPQFPLFISDLRSLHLEKLPMSGLETMARCLSALPKLKTLFITFKSPRFNPQSGNRPELPQIRFVLPALTFLEFQGVTEDLEALAAQIEAPVLKQFRIYFFHLPGVAFDIPQTVRFFGHLEWFRLSTLSLKFSPALGTSIFFSSNMMSDSTSRHCHMWHIKCFGLGRQVISVAQICSQILPFRSSVQSLIIKSSGYYSKEWNKYMTDHDPTIWLQLFHTFPSVRTLSIPNTLEPFIAAALQGLMGRSVTEVFPSLHSLSIDGIGLDETARRSVESFIAARQRSGPAVAVSYNPR